MHYILEYNQPAGLFSAKNAGECKYETAFTEHA